MDKRYLEQRRQGWYVVVEVPPSMREAIGQKRLRRSLKTRDIHIARVSRWAVVAELKAIIDKAKVQTQGDPIIAEALKWRETLTASNDDDNEGIFTSLMTDRAQDIDRKHGYKKAQQFADISTGKLTPVDTTFELWLKGISHTARTVMDHRRALQLLTDWAVREGLFVSVEALNRKTVNRFIDAGLGNLHPKTKNKYISSFSSFWRWMIRRGYTETNPWSLQSVPKKTMKRAEQERAFTDDEVQQLLNGNADQTIADLMRLGALSGMRLEGICKLTVIDTLGEAFNVQQAKTASGIRKVPIHSELTEIVLRRTKDKAPTDFLFNELSSYGPDKERSMAVSKRFGRYRQKCGVDEKLEGIRRSLVNFHSWRRWFITKAEQAGIEPWVIEAVVGHKRQGESLGRYSAGPSVEQRRQCIEAVRLPML